MEGVAYINNTPTDVLPRLKRSREVVDDVPEGFMSLEQFEKELVEVIQ